MGFIMAGLDKDDYDREYSDLTLIRRILGYFVPYKKFLFLLITGLTFASLSQTFVPVLISNTLESFETGITQEEVNMFVFLLLFFSAFTFLMNMLQQQYTFKSTSSAVYDLRSDVFNSLLKKDMSFFDSQPSGRLASRITNDTQEFAQVVQLSSNLIGQFLILFFLLFFLLARSVKLTILIFIFAPVIFLVAISFRKIARKVALASQRVLAKVNALVQETTSGIYVAKSFRAESYIYNEFSDLNQTSYKTNFQRGVVFSSIFPILNTLSGFITALVIFYGASDLLGNDVILFGIAIPKEELTIGAFFLFIQGLYLFFFPLIQIASFWSQFQQGLAASERVFALMDKENQVVQYDNLEIENPKGHIQIKDVTFAYKEGENIFENFSLEIKPGENVAIVGHTGAGKSTLAKLLTRSYEFQNGKILIDGYDIRSLDIDKYRKNLATITQEVFLWNSSIKDNLIYGLTLDTEDPDEKLREVLSKVEVLDWVTKLEKGLETKIGDRGSKLSMGQRQLISFARILLQNPSILIMDEATASVDPLTELSIQNATNILLQGRTSIIVAHRLSTIKKADRIIVIDHGKIVEEGNHDSLMEKNGYYADLYNTYYRHQSLKYIEEMAKE